MKALLRVFGFAAALAILWGLAFALSWGVTRGSQFTQRKLEGADRVLYYRFSPTQRPRFQLSGAERELSLVTHVVLPPGTPYVPGREYDYGVVLRLLAPSGQAVWEQRVFTRSRQSKADLIDGVWMRENTFAIDPNRQFGDDRVLRVSLPPQYPPQSRLEVGLLASDGFEGLLRVYERSERTTIDAEVVRLGLSPRDKRQLLQRLTHLPWTALTEVQRWTRLRFRWNRLSAVGDDENDNPTETVFFTGFRTAPPTEHVPRTLALGPSITRALNVTGPALLGFHPAPGCEAAPQARIHVQEVTPKGRGRRGTLQACTAVQTWWIGPGFHSLHLRADEPAELFVRLHEGQPFVQPRSPDEDGVHPDTTRILVYQTGPDTTPLRFSLPASGGIDARTLRVDVRAPLHAAEAPSVELLFEFLDEDGSVVEHGSATLELDASGPRFEVLVRDEEEVAVSEAAMPRLIAPKAARELRVSTAQPAVVAVKAFLPLDQPVRVAAPYRHVALDRARWRYAPLDTRRWWPLRANNHIALEGRGAVDVLWAQVRLVPLEPSPRDPRSPSEAKLARASSSSDPWRTADPVNSYEFHPILERAPAGSDTEGHRYTRLHLARKTRIDVDTDEPPQVLYHLHDERARGLGETVAVHVDDEVSLQRISTRRGQWVLPQLSRGRHVVGIDAPTNALTLFIDQPGRGPTYRRRTLHRLDERPLALEIDKPDEHPVYVNAVFYRCGTRRGTTVQLDLDDGDPRRVRGRVVERVTVAERELRLDGPGTRTDVVFLARPAERCRIVGRFPLAMGEDIAPGRHRFTLRVTQGEALWVRFFQATTPDNDDAQLLRWFDRADDEGDAHGE